MPKAESRDKRPYPAKIRATPAPDIRDTNSMPPSVTQKPFGQWTTMAATARSAAIRPGTIGPPRPRIIRALPAGRAGHECRAERALAIVVATWTLLILHNLMDGPQRFGELARMLPGSTPKILSARLRELEQLGLLTRTAYPEVPPRVEYKLTRQGRTLRPIIDSLERWGEDLKPVRAR